MKRFLLFLSFIACNALQGSETDPNLVDKPPCTYLTVCQEMEETERAINDTSTPNQFCEAQSSPLGTALLALTAEVVGGILSYIVSYQDQWSFFMCCVGAKDYAKFVKKTHINKLSSLKKGGGVQPSHPFISLLTGLEYLCITHCNIDNVGFDSKKLKGLSIKCSNVPRALLLQQRFLQYLDIRSPPSSSPHGDLSSNNPDLQATLQQNPNLLVLKLTIAHSENAEKNIYELLSSLTSLEFVDINNNPNHVHYLKSLTNLQELIFSSYEPGRMEAHYESITESKAFTELQLGEILKLKCLMEGQIWQIDPPKSTSGGVF